MNTLWAILSLKYRRYDNLYDIIFGVCVSLTNFNTSPNPLREVDGQRYSLLRKRLLSIGEEISRKRNMAQRYYRLKRRRNLDFKFREMDDSDDYDVTQTETLSNL